MENARAVTVKQGHYVCEDGVWYACVDVVKPDGEPLAEEARKSLHLVERGYVCEDGVWYRQLAAERV